MQTPTTVVSFRAEYWGDAAAALTALELHCNTTAPGQLKWLEAKIARNYGGTIAEPLVEITSVNLPPEEILNVLRGLEEGHVMVQTFKPVPMEQNDFKRNFDQE